MNWFSAVNVRAHPIFEIRAGQCDDQKSNARRSRSRSRSPTFSPSHTRTSFYSPARFVQRARLSLSTISRTSSSLGFHRPRSSTSTSDAMAGLISPSPVSFLQGGGGGGNAQQQQQYNMNVGQSLPQAYQQHQQQQQQRAGTLGLGGGLGAGGGVSVNLPFSDTPPLPAHLSHQQVSQYMNALQGGGLGLPVGVGVGGVGVGSLGGVGLGAGGVGSIGGVSPSHEEGKLFSLVIDLMDPNTRETALLELSKKREQYDDLAMILWHSFGACFLLIQRLGPSGRINRGSVNRDHASIASRDRLCLPLAFAPQLDRSCV